MNRFEEILARMLSQVPEHLDKSVGSVIYTTLAPTAALLAEGFACLEAYKHCFSISEATGDMLTALCAEYGMTRAPAAPAVYEVSVQSKAGTPMSLPVGTRLVADLLEFAVTEAVSARPGVHIVTALAPGSEGNSLLQFEIAAFLPDLGAITNPILLEAGCEEESDEALRARYVRRVNSLPFGGNRADYERLLLEQPEVGAVRMQIHSEQKLLYASVVGPDMQPLSELAVQNLQDRICPLTTMGTPTFEGLAPIGQTVKIGTPTLFSLPLHAKITFDAAYDNAQVISALEAAYANYLHQSAFTERTVPLSRLLVLFMEVAGVLDVVNLKINGHAANFTMPQNDTFGFLAQSGGITLE